MRVVKRVLGVFLLLGAFLLPLPGQEEAEPSPEMDATETLVVFKDGRRLIGRIRRKAGKLHMIETPLKRVYYNKDSVASTGNIAADPPVIFDRGEPRAANRPKLQAVVYDLKWQGWTPDSALTFSCKDPKLGTVTDSLECVRFSADLCFLDGIKYRWPRAWEIPQLSMKFFGELPPAKTFDEKLDRVRFLRQAEQFDMAEQLFEGLASTDEEDQAKLNTEKARLKQGRDLAEEREGNRVVGLGPKNRPKMPTGFPEEARRKLQDWWNRGAPLADVESLARALDTNHKLDKETWVTAVRALGHPKTVVKPYDPTNPAVRPTSVVHWSDGGQDRHYSVFLPQDYDPNKRYATIFAMHGQTSNDENYIQAWLEPAVRYQMIVVSIEYIYGRKWFYRYDKQDMDAVMGAVADARWRFAVDPERSYLIGHSQGGHTNYDISQSYVNEFTASAPYIGAPYQTQVQLIHQSHYPMYMVGGDSDAAAPKYCREGIKDLLKYESPSVYVEYISRGHESFGEENDDMLLFLASHTRDKPWPWKTESHWARSQEGARHWLRIPEGIINTTQLRAKSKTSLLSLKGAWKGRKIKITGDKRLHGQRLDILIPHWYEPDPKKPLEIMFNRKDAYEAMISGWDLEDFLREVGRRNDRWTPVREVISLELPPRIK